MGKKIRNYFIWVIAIALFFTAYYYIFLANPNLSSYTRYENNVKKEVNTETKNAALNRVKTATEDIKQYKKTGLLKHIELKTWSIFIDKKKFLSLNKAAQINAGKDFNIYFLINGKSPIVVRFRDVKSRKVIAVYTTRTDEILYPW